MRKLYIIIGVVCPFLLSSCGKQYSAESTVKDFIKENALAPEKMEVLKFGKLNSTSIIKDSMLQNMQSQKNPLYKESTTFAPRQGATLFFVRMEYVYENDTLQQTFYLDESLEKVVAFK